MFKITSVDSRRQMRSKDGVLWEFPPLLKILRLKGGHVVKLYSRNGDSNAED